MKNQEHRIKFKQESTMRIPPKGDEIDQIHKILMHENNL